MLLGVDPVLNGCVVVMNHVEVLVGWTSGGGVIAPAVVFLVVAESLELVDVRLRVCRIVIVSCRLVLM